MEGNYLKIIFIVDESGSMQGSESDVVGGFNNYIQRQRSETVGKVTVSLYKFNSLVSSVIVNKPIAKIKELNQTHYSPSGFTALYDAIGKAIQETDSQISSISEKQRPDKVLMVIITDGQENASKEFSSQYIDCHTRKFTQLGFRLFRSWVKRFYRCRCFRVEKSD